ncbi:MAG TPA: DUF3568 family protein [Longimicrobiaceae bacterium]|nr:DUF3568 family protein [Longimicrobiaceae bacterium]
MQSRILHRTQTMVALAGVALLSACVAAAAGAGAAAGIYLTSQGASTTVTAPLATVDARTQAVLADMGITVMHREVEDDGIEYHGTGNGMDIAVELDQGDDGTVKVTASARKNEVDWDKEYARTIVQRIAEQ